jgi:hypothetical protein
VRQRNRFAGRRLGAAVALTTVTFLGSLTLAPAAFASSAVVSPAAHSAPVQPNAVGDCTQTLEYYGYDLTWGRFTSCLLAQVGGNSGLYACFTGLQATGVATWIAAVACTAGAYM